MADKSDIEWLAGGSTWNMIRARNLATDRVGWHCTHVSEACRNCYAESMNAWRGTGLAYKPGHEKDIAIFLDHKTLVRPIQWQEPRRIFPCSMTDLFGTWVTDAMLDRVFAVMALAPRHTFLPLTKRPERMVAYLKPSSAPFPPDYAYCRVLVAATSLRMRWPKLHVPISDPAAGAWWPHVMLGCSIGDQPDADEFRPHMAQLAAQGWRTWVSYEPALGPVDWKGWEFLTWMVSGGESGKHARPSHTDWHRGTWGWCQEHDIPYHFKQHGEYVILPTDRERKKEHIFLTKDFDYVRVGKRRAGRLLDGRTHDGFPEIRR